MTGIILAGGENRRMGRKKAFIEIEGVRIIDKTLDVFKSIFNEIIIISNTPEDYEFAGVKVFSDAIPGKGSLGGLYTGIKESAFERCFVAACDMPYIDAGLVRYIAAVNGYDIVVPKVKGFYEPLFASYSKVCAEVMRKQLVEGNMKISDIYSKVKVREVNEDEMRAFDQKLLSFININTPEDLERL